MLVLLLGFHGSFALSALMATLATITLVVMRRPLIEVASEKDQQSVSMGNWIAFTLLSLAMVGLVFFMFSNMVIGQNIVYAIGLAAIVYFINLMLKARRAEALKMGTILIVTVLTTCFFVYYGQMMTSMTMVTINTMRGELFGIIPIAPEASGHESTLVYRGRSRHFLSVSYTRKAWHYLLNRNQNRVCLCANRYFIWHSDVCRFHRW